MLRPIAYPVRMKTWLAFLLLPLISLSVEGQAEGEYKGELKVPGVTLEMIIQLEEDAGKWQGDLDIPAQMIRDMELVDLEVSVDSVRFRLPEVPGNASYAGAFESDSLIGVFTQMGRDMPLVFYPRDQVDLTPVLEQVELLADSALRMANVAGMSIGIVYQGEVAYLDGFGYADVESGVEASDQTVYAIGSTSKAFTAAGVASLVSEGKLEWSDPVRDHIPGFQLYDAFATQEMTSVDLLCHNSGLPRHDLMWYGSDFTRKELLHRLRFLEPTHSFRSTWQYQNLMYMTAGILIEEIDGRDWETFTRETFFVPLQMSSSNFSVKEMEANEKAATGYRYTDSAFVELPYRNIDAIGPAGSINSSVTDMSRWVKFLLNQGNVDGKVLIDASDMNRLFKPAMVMGRGSSYEGRSEPDYALGWMIENYKGMKVVKHGGNIDGFSAEVQLIPEKELGVVVLTNANGSPLPSLFAMHIIDLVLDMEPIDYLGSVFGEKDKKDEDLNKDEDVEDGDDGRVEGTLPSHSLGDFAGSYKHDGYGMVQIDLVADSLELGFNAFDGTLTHYHYDVFEVYLQEVGEKIKIQFESDLFGDIDACLIQLEPSLPPISFTRTGQDTLYSPSYLMQFVGEYKTEAGLVIQVDFEKEKLFLKPAGQPVFELLPIDEYMFRPRDLDGYKVEFVRDGDQIIRAILRQPNGVFPAEKVTK